MFINIFYFKNIFLLNILISLKINQYKNTKLNNINNTNLKNESCILFCLF